MMCLSRMANLMRLAVYGTKDIFRALYILWEAYVIPTMFENRY